MQESQCLLNKSLYDHHQVERLHQLNISCQPIAINSGYVWPKNGLKSKNKTIIISILKPISAGLKKEEFLNILQKNIYSELDIIN